MLLALIKNRQIMAMQYIKKVKIYVFYIKHYQV